MQKTFTKIYNETNISKVLKKTKKSKKNITLTKSSKSTGVKQRPVIKDPQRQAFAIPLAIGTLAGNFYYFFGPITASAALFIVSSVNCIVPSTISPVFLIDPSITAPDVSTAASTVLPALVNISLVSFSVLS